MLEMLGIIVLANVLSVGLLLLIYFNFQLLQEQLRPIMWAFVWALALYPVKKQWIIALRAAYSDGLLAILPLEGCMVHSSTDASASTRDTSTLKVSIYWNILWAAYAIYVVIIAPPFRFIALVAFLSIFFSRRCVKLSAGLCTHGICDDAKYFLKTGRDTASRSYQATTRYLVPTSWLPPAALSVLRCIGFGCQLVFSSVGTAVWSMLLFFVRAVSNCFRSAGRFVSGSMSLESAVAMALTFGLLLGAVTVAIIVVVQVRMTDVCFCAGVILKSGWPRAS